MRRSAFLLALTALAACAPGPQPIPASRTDRTTVVIQTPTTSRHLETTHEASISSRTVRAAPEAVWALLPGIYEQMGIPVTQVDTGAKVIGTANRRLRRIDGQSLTTFFHCSSSYSTAASLDVYVTVRTQVSDGGGGTSLLRTEGGAYAQGTGAGSTVRCGSTGLLEARIAQRVQELAGARP